MLTKIHNRRATRNKYDYMKKKKSEMEVIVKRVHKLENNFHFPVARVSKVC